jgi:hypothetical protein
MTFEMVIVRMNLVGLAVFSMLPSLFGADNFGFQLPDWAVESLKQYPALVFGLVVFWLAFKHILAQHQDHLASKDKEIERLVKERDKLQNIVLKTRLSTDESSPPSGQQPKRKP